MSSFPAHRWLPCLAGSSICLWTQRRGICRMRYVKLSCFMSGWRVLGKWWDFSNEQLGWLVYIFQAFGFENDHQILVNLFEVLLYGKILITWIGCWVNIGIRLIPRVDTREDQENPSWTLLHHVAVDSPPQKAPISIVLLLMSYIYRQSWLSFAINRNWSPEGST